MKRITKYLLLVLLLGGVHAQIAFAETNQCANLSRNLRIGDKGEDVRLLQKVLNADKTTTVASSGPGAFGEETTYFGERTKNAVAKFQEAHFNEILVPAGLTRGSGFVGTFTRERIRAFCAKTALASVPTQLTTGSASGKLVIPPTTTLLKLAANSPVLANQNLTNLYSLINKSTTTSSGTTATAPKPLAAPVGEKLELTSLSDVQVSIGGKIVAHATGLDSSNNLVHVGTATIASLPPSKLGQITFTIPQHSSLGSQDVWLSNSRGTSGAIGLIVKDPGAVAPEITSFTPTDGPNGTSVILTGTGITKTGNDIYVSSGKISNVSSSDEKTLQFTVTLNLPNMGKSGKHASFPVWFYVANKNGLSKPKVFTIKT